MKTRLNKNNAALRARTASKSAKAKKSLQAEETNQVEEASNVDAKDFVEDAVSDGFEKGSSIAQQNAAQDVPSFQLGGMKIQGLDLASIQEGKVTIDMPLSKGTFFVPSPEKGMKDIKLKVPKDMTVKVNLEVGRPNGGAPCITDAKLEFSDFLVIANPTQSLQPQFRQKFLNKFADAVADMCIKDLTVDQNDGKVKMDGKIRYLGMFGKNHTLNDKVKDKMPSLNLELGAIGKDGVLKADATDAGTAQKVTDAKDKVKGAATGKGGAAQAQQNQAVNDSMAGIMNLLGALTGEATFKIDAMTDPTSLVVDTPNLRIETPNEPVRVQADGKASLNAEGQLTMSVDAPDFLQTGGAKLGLDTEVRASHLMTGGNVKFDGDVKTDLNIEKGGIKGVVRPEEGVELDVRLQEGGRVSADAKLQGDGPSIQATGGNAAWMLRVDTEGLDIPAAQVSTDSSTHVVTSGTTNFALDKNNSFTTEKGDMQIRLTGDDLQVQMGDLRAKLEGGTELVLNASDVATNDGSVGKAKGDMNMELNLGPSIPSFKQDLTYEIHDNLLRTNRGDLQNPFISTDMMGNPNVELMAQPAVGSLSSTAMRERIAEITGAPVRKNNATELIVDGADSMKRTLDMINGAGKGDTLFAQALIFKDDATGTELAEAYAAAAKRGADVNVIIDALGNVTGLDDIIEGKNIYKTMRDAGVEVKLYNNIGAEAFKSLVDIAKARDELPDLNSFEQLVESPAKAVNVLSAFFKAGQGNIPGLPKDVQTQVADALVKLHSALGSSEPLDLGAINTDNVLDSKEMMYIAKQMETLNHRWHEKYRGVVKANGESELITGGRNFGDMYLKKGGDFYTEAGRKRPVWRDIDIHVKGQAAHDAMRQFNDNWETVTGKRFEEPPMPTGDLANKGTSDVQMIQHRPRIDKDHNILHAKVELLKSMGPGDTYYIQNAYFLPTESLTHLKDAMIDAAQRGVNIVISTNSENTTDAPQINHAAIYEYRDLLEKGEGNIKIFERKVEDPLPGHTDGARCIHSKYEAFISKDPETGKEQSVVAVTSYNNDNRSGALNSEAMCLVYDDEKLAKDAVNTIVGDTQPDVAVELKADDVKAQEIPDEMRSLLTSIFSPLL